MARKPLGELDPLGERGRKVHVGHQNGISGRSENARPDRRPLSAVLFVAQDFPMSNKDLMYVSNAPATQIQKFLNLLLSTVYPIQGAVSLTK